MFKQIENGVISKLFYCEDESFDIHDNTIKIATNINI